MFLHVNSTLACIMYGWVLTSSSGSDAQSNIYGKVDILGTKRSFRCFMSRGIDRPGQKRPRGKGDRHCAVLPILIIIPTVQRHWRRATQNSLQTYWHSSCFSCRSRSRSATLDSACIFASMQGSAGQRAGSENKLKRDLIFVHDMPISVGEIGASMKKHPVVYSLLR